MRATVLFLVAALIGTAHPSVAQSVDSITALRRDLDELRREQAATLHELQEIRRLMSDQRAQGGPVSTPETIDGRGPSLGRVSAPITIVEFSDYQCPFCGQFFRETLPLLVAEYVKIGRVRLVYHDFPLSSLHPSALKAAEAARCAGDQQRYWEYHDALFQNQSSLEETKLVQRALMLELDTTAFNRCLKSGHYSNAIKQSIAEGEQAGVDGTPTFFLGTLDPGTTNVRVAHVIQGAKAYAEFKEVIQELISTLARDSSLIRNGIDTDSPSILYRKGGFRREF
jgi:protein-disulfide isomerase